MVVSTIICFYNAQNLCFVLVECVSGCVVSATTKDSVDERAGSTNYVVGIVMHEAGVYH